MKKMNRIISSMVLVCFLFNTAISDLAFGQDLVRPANSDKLAIASRYNDISGLEANHEMKIKAILQAQLKKIAGNSNSIDTGTLPSLLASFADTNDKSSTSLEFSVPGTQLFSHELKSLPNGYFRVMCRITNPSINQKPRTYYAVFATEKDQDAGFPIYVYTETEYKGFAKSGTLSKVMANEASGAYSVPASLNQKIFPTGKEALKQARQDSAVRMSAAGGLAVETTVGLANDLWELDSVSSVSLKGLPEADYFIKDKQVLKSAVYNELKILADKYSIRRLPKARYLRVGDIFLAADLATADRDRFCILVKKDAAGFHFVTLPVLGQVECLIVEYEPDELALRSLNQVRFIGTREIGKLREFSRTAKGLLPQKEALEKKIALAKVSPRNSASGADEAELLKLVEEAVAASDGVADALKLIRSASGKHEAQSAYDTHRARIKAQKAADAAVNRCLGQIKDRKVLRNVIAAIEGNPNLKSHEYYIELIKARMELCPGEVVSSDMKRKSSSGAAEDEKDLSKAKKDAQTLNNFANGKRTFVPDEVPPTLAVPSKMEKLNVAALTEAVIAAINSDFFTKIEEKEETIESWNNFIKERATGGMIVNIADVKEALAAEIKSIKSNNNVSGTISAISMGIGSVVFVLGLINGLPALCMLGAGAVISGTALLLLPENNKEISETLTGYFEKAEKELAIAAKGADITDGTDRTSASGVEADRIDYEVLGEKVAKNLGLFTSDIIVNHHPTIRGKFVAAVLADNALISHYSFGLDKDMNIVDLKRAPASLDNLDRTSATGADKKEQLAASGVDIRKIAKEAGKKIRSAISNASPQNCALKLVWWNVNKRGTPYAQVMVEPLNLYRIRQDEDIEQEVIAHLQGLLNQLRTPGILSYKFEPGVDSAYVRGELSWAVTLRVETPGPMQTAAAEASRTSASGADLTSLDPEEISILASQLERDGINLALADSLYMVTGTMHNPVTVDEMVAKMKKDSWIQKIKGKDTIVALEGGFPLNKTAINTIKYTLLQSGLLKDAAKQIRTSASGEAKFYGPDWRTKDEIEELPSVKALLQELRKNDPQAVMDLVEVGREYVLAFYTRVKHDQNYFTSFIIDVIKETRMPAQVVYVNPSEAMPDQDRTSSSGEISITDLDMMNRVLQQDVIDMIVKAGSGHPGGSLSMLKMVTALYFGRTPDGERIMRYDPQDPAWVNRDRFVLSKGHAAPGLYAALCRAGFFLPNHLDTLRQLSSILQGHPDMTKTPGVDMSTGSLGIGLSAAAGMAFAAKMDGRDYMTYAMLGDGEVQEGQIAEAARHARAMRLDNLVAFLDWNGKQIDGDVTKVDVDYEGQIKKWEAMEWNVIPVDGDNMRAIISAIGDAKNTKNGRPTIIIARTKKGAGLPGMEKHGSVPKPEEVASATEIIQKDLDRLNGDMVPFTRDLFVKRIAGKSPIFDSEKNIIDEDNTKRFEARRAEVIKNIQSEKAQAIITEVKKAYPDGAKVATRTADGDELVLVGADDPDVVAMTADLKDPVMFAKLASAFGEYSEYNPIGRYVNIGIGEAHMFSFAAGLASCGKIPAIGTFSVFTTRTFDQANAIVKTRLPIIIVGTHGGLATEGDGASHQDTNSQLVLGALPCVKLIEAVDAEETRLLVRQIYDRAKTEGGRFYIRPARPNTHILKKPEGWQEGAKKGFYTLYDSHAGNLTEMKGRYDVVIVSTGVVANDAIEAAKYIAAQGKKVRVVNVCQLTEIASPAKRAEFARLVYCDNLVTVIDALPKVLGSIVNEVLIAKRIVPQHVINLGINKFGESGKAKNLYRLHKFDKDGIINAALNPAQVKDDRLNEALKELPQDSPDRVNIFTERVELWREYVNEFITENQGKMGKDEFDAELKRIGQLLVEILDQRNSLASLLQGAAGQGTTGERKSASGTLDAQASAAKELLDKWRRAVEVYNLRAGSVRDITDRMSRMTTDTEEHKALDRSVWSMRDDGVNALRDMRVIITEAKRIGVELPAYGPLANEAKSTWRKQAAAAKTHRTSSSGAAGEQVLPSENDWKPTWENVINMLISHPELFSFTITDYVIHTRTNVETAHAMLSRIATQGLLEIKTNGDSDWRYELTSTGEGELQLAIAQSKSTRKSSSGTLLYRDDIDVRTNVVPRETASVYPLFSIDGLTLRFGDVTIPTNVSGDVINTKINDEMSERYGMQAEYDSATQRLTLINTKYGNRRATIQLPLRTFPNNYDMDVKIRQVRDALLEILPVRSVAAPKMLRQSSSGTEERFGRQRLTKDEILAIPSVQQFLGMLRRDDPDATVEVEEDFLVFESTDPMAPEKEITLLMQVIEDTGLNTWVNIVDVHQADSKQDRTSSSGTADRSATYTIDEKHAYFAKLREEAGKSVSKAAFELQFLEADGRVGTETVVLPTEKLSDNMDSLIDYLATLISIRGMINGVTKIAVLAEGEKPEYIIERLNEYLLSKFGNTEFMISSGRGVGFTAEPLEAKVSAQEEAAEPVKVDYDKGVGIGFDLGGQGIKFAQKAKPGEKIVNGRVDMKELMNHGALESFIERKIRETEAAMGHKVSPKNPVVITIPGPVTSDGRIVLITNLEETRPGTKQGLEQLQAKYPRGSFIFQNDANVPGYYYTVAEDIQGNVIFNTLGTGLGLAVLKDQKLGAGPMEAHIRLTSDANAVYHRGMRLGGDLESYANAQFVEWRAEQLCAKKGIKVTEKLSPEIVAGWLNDSFTGPEKSVATQVFNEFGSNLAVLYSEIARVRKENDWTIIYTGGIAQGKAVEEIIKGVNSAVKSKYPHLKLNIRALPEAANAGAIGALNLGIQAAAQAEQASRKSASGVENGAEKPEIEAKPEPSRLMVIRKNLEARLLRPGVLKVDFYTTTSDNIFTAEAIRREGDEEVEDTYEVTADEAGTIIDIRQRTGAQGARIDSLIAEYRTLIEEHKSHPKPSSEAVVRQGMQELLEGLIKDETNAGSGIDSETRYKMIRAQGIAELHALLDNYRIDNEATRKTYSDLLDAMIVERLAGNGTTRKSSSGAETQIVAGSVEDLLNNIKGTAQVVGNSIQVQDRSRFINETVDYLAREAALSENPEVKVSAQRILRKAALSFNVKLASINDFYMAKASGKWANITVPAVNGRTDVYNQYRQLFRAAREKNVGALVLELARSEMRYSAQDAGEFTAVSLAAAIRQGYEGLVFTQGDHYQVDRKKYDKGGEDRENELKAIETLIRKAMEAGMYNIDIDPSTLVDESALKRILTFETNVVDRYLKLNPGLITGLDENGVRSVRRRLVDEIEVGDKKFFLTPEDQGYIEEQYRQMHSTTAAVTMHFIRYIRRLEKELGFPEGMHISIGIEERHIDKPEHKNNPSTVLGSMTLARSILSSSEIEGLVGPSKLSLQTGTMHGVGGEVDFGIYQRHLEYRDKIGLAVFVQHGASTLEKEDFDKMRSGDVGEVHLATEYQKMELGLVSRLMPHLGAEMAGYLDGLMDKNPDMGTKFRPMWNLAFGNKDLAVTSIKPDDKEREVKITLYSILEKTQSGKDRATIITEILGDTMPKGLKGTLKDLVKELPGPFKRQLMDLPAAVREAVDKALYEEFSTIFEKLGATNTRDIVGKIIPLDKQPVILSAKPQGLQDATRVSSTGTTSEDPAMFVCSINNNRGFRVPMANRSLREALKSLALNPDVLLATAKTEAPRVLVNGIAPVVDTLNPGDAVTINYKSPLVFLRRQDNADGQHFYRDNYPLTTLQIYALIDTAGMIGITTNLSIFQKCAASGQFNDAIEALVAQGIVDPTKVYDKVTMPAFQKYARLIGNLTFDFNLKKVLGTASYEVPPQYIHDAWSTQRYQDDITGLAPESVMVKTPATASGFKAVRTMAMRSRIVRDNITLMFGFDQWLESQRAQIEKLEYRVEQGMSVGDYFGVDSFFLSRTDILINTIFDKLAASGKLTAEDRVIYEKIKDKVAVAQAKIVGRWNNYLYFRGTLPEGTPQPEELRSLRDRFIQVQKLANQRTRETIRPRIPLWASTQVKEPDIKRGVDPLLYFVNLVGRRTVNTMPDGLIAAIEDRFKYMTDYDKEVAIRKLDAAIYDDRIITKYDPNGKIEYFEEMTPAEIIAAANGIIAKYTSQIMDITGTHPSKENSGVSIREEIGQYNARLERLHDEGTLELELYEKEVMPYGSEFKLDLEKLAKLLTWRGGDLFEADYQKSIDAFEAKIKEAEARQSSSGAVAESAEPKTPQDVLDRVYVQVQDRDGSMTAEQQFEAVYGILSTDLPALAEKLAGLRELLTTARSYSEVIKAVNEVTSSLIERRILFHAFKSDIGNERQSTSGAEDRVSLAQQIVSMLWPATAEGYRKMGRVPEVDQDSVTLLDGNDGCFAFLANNGTEDAIVFAYTPETEQFARGMAESAGLQRLPLFKGTDGRLVVRQNLKAEVFKYNADAWARIARVDRASAAGVDGVTWPEDDNAIISLSAEAAIQAERFLSGFTSAEQLKELAFEMGLTIIPDAKVFIHQLLTEGMIATINTEGRLRELAFETGNTLIPDVDKFFKQALVEGIITFDTNEDKDIARQSGKNVKRAITVETLKNFMRQMGWLGESLSNPREFFKLALTSGLIAYQTEEDRREALVLNKGNDWGAVSVERLEDLAFRMGITVIPDAKIFIHNALVNGIIMTTEGKESLATEDLEVSSRSTTDGQLKDLAIRRGKTVIPDFSKFMHAALIRGVVALQTEEEREAILKAIHEAGRQSASGEETPQAERIKREAKLAAYQEHPKEREIADVLTTLVGKLNMKPTKFGEENILVGDLQSNRLLTVIVDTVSSDDEQAEERDIVFHAAVHTHAPVLNGYIIGLVDESGEVVDSATLDQENVAVFTNVDTTKSYAFDILGKDEEAFTVATQAIYNATPILPVVDSEPIMVQPYSPPIDAAQIAEHVSNAGTIAEEPKTFIDTEAVTSRQSTTGSVTEKIAAMAMLADAAGKDMPTDAATRYNLLVTPEFFASGELARHRNVYGDRFTIDTFDTANLKTRMPLSDEEIVTGILSEAKDIEARTAVLINKDTSKDQLDRLAKANIRFILVDTKELLAQQADRYSKDEAVRRYRDTFQVDTYVKMLLVRRIDASMDINSAAYNVLRFYIATHFKLEGVAVDEYIQAIVNNEVAKLIKGYLSYRPAEPYDVPEYKTIAAALIAA